MVYTVLEWSVENWLLLKAQNFCSKLCIESMVGMPLHKFPLGLLSFYTSVVKNHQPLDFLMKYFVRYFYS